MPDAPTPTTREQRLPAAAKWLAGVLIVLAVAAGMIYSYRHRPSSTAAGPSGTPKSPAFAHRAIR